ncbi:MAG: hypothetical protein JWN89_404 [Parcubacteria group bacterium]|nr:hypothetical protein [Parcubacteria group bacterium]
MKNIFRWCRPENYHPSPLLRSFQLFLLVLIIIGLFLLATERYWIGPLVSYILNQ